MSLDPSLNAGNEQKQGHPPDAARSAAALRLTFPDLNERWPADDLKRHLVVAADGFPVDIDLGTARLYRGDARTVTAGQIAAYRQAPFRVFRTLPGGDNLCHGIGLGFMEFVRTRCQALVEHGGELTTAPKGDGGILVVFGVGLGYHLDALIALANPRSVVLIEPVPEFLALSCHAIDWQDFLDRHRANGRRFKIIVTPHESDLIEQITLELAQDGAIHLDGAWIFIHYPSDLFIKIRDQLPEHYERIFAITGFFEDEQIMFVNTLNNYRRNRFSLIPGLPPSRRKEPILLIGAGGSLDRDIEEIRRLRPGAMVMSCGTALQSCLAHGLTPDFHLECENAAHSVDILEHAASRHGLAGIVLVAALTVDPRLPPMFEQSLMYVRPYVSATTMLGPAEHALLLAFPTAVNSGARAAVCLGFRELYLFGADFGARVAEQWHAQKTAYQDLGFLIAEEKNPILPVIVPGNFGGLVQSNVVYSIGRENLRLLIHHSGVRVVNCSDGARIDGTETQQAASLRLPPLRRGAQAVRDDVIRALPLLEPGAFLDAGLGVDLGAGRLERLAAEHQRFFTALMEQIDQAIADLPDIITFWSHLLPLLEPDGYHGVPTLVAGTLKGMARYSAFFLTRITDPQSRKDLFLALLPELRRLVVHMRDESKGWLIPASIIQPQP